MDLGSMKLKFPQNDTGEAEGLSDAGIETFKENSYSSAARESAQNSRDAALEFPVRVAYDLIMLKPSEIPDFESLRIAVEACAAGNEELKDLKTEQFFKRALAVLELEEIPALRISDFGTSGVSGPCKAGTPFHALVKSSGITNKGDPTSGGSFGIGKKAAFAISDLHTVFYSTSYGSEASDKFLAQGKCTLTSHRVASQDFRATGYWGADGYLPVDSINDAPTWLRRSEIGTTTISLGFDATEGWQFRIAESLARNFVGAIESGQLEFFVDDGSIVLNRSNIREQLRSQPLRDSAIENNSREDLELACQVYECLTGAKTDRVEKSFLGVGRIKLHILLGDGLPQRVAILRNGMFVADNLTGFGERFSNFPSYKDFVAVIEPADDAASATLKRLENPAHSSFSSERIVDLSERAAIKKSMEAMARWVRGQIKSLAYQPAKTEASIDELNEFFGEPGIPDKSASGKSDESTPGRIIFRAQKPKFDVSNPDYSIDGDDDPDAGGAPGSNLGKKEGGEGSGTGKGVGTGGSSGEAVSFQELRTMHDPSDIKLGRILYFTPHQSGIAKLSVIAKGMNNDSVIPGIEVLGDSLASPLVRLTAGERKSVRIRFQENYNGPINISLRIDVKKGGEE